MKAFRTIRKTPSNMSDEYIDAKMKALDAVVSVSIAFRHKYNMKQRLKLL